MVPIADLQQAGHPIMGQDGIDRFPHATRLGLSAPAPTARMQCRDFRLGLGQPAAPPPLPGLGQLARPDHQAPLPPVVRLPGHLRGHGFRPLKALRDQLRVPSGWARCIRLKACSPVHTGAR